MWGPTVPVIGGPQRSEVPAWANTVSWSIFGSGVVTLTEVITSLVVPNWQKQPWDRNPVFYVLRQGPAEVPGGTPSTAGFSATVAAGKLVRINTISCSATPFQPLTTVGGSAVYVQIDNSIICYADARSGTQGQQATDLLIGPLDLPAGSVIQGFWFNSNVGGSVVMASFVSGYQFDA
jgi:hypothetical protein